MAELRARVEAARAAVVRRERVVAIGGQVRALATNRAALATAGAAAAVAVAVWMWAAATAPDSGVAPDRSIEAIGSALLPWQFVEFKRPVLAQTSRTEGSDVSAVIVVPRSAEEVWLNEELAAIRALLARQEFGEAQVRIQQALARAPLAPELSVLADQARSALENRNAETARARQIAALLATAQSPSETPAGRREAASEVLKLDPQNAEARDVLRQLDRDETPKQPPPPVQTDNGLLRRAAEVVIRGQVVQFGAAFQEKDVGALRRLWPSMPRSVEDSYRGVFRSYSRIGWVLQNVQVEIDGNSAVAVVNAQLEFRALRSNDATTERRTYRFTFERSQVGWTIATVENLR